MVAVCRQTISVLLLATLVAEGHGGLSHPLKSNVRDGASHSLKVTHGGTTCGCWCGQQSCSCVSGWREFPSKSENINS